MSTRSIPFEGFLRELQGVEPFDLIFEYASKHAAAPCLLAQVPALGLGIHALDVVEL